jgi:diguanylate cyclase (GGDEF)-like protein/PAS domain S-box-containing protein
VLLENIGDGIIAHTLEGRIVYANQCAAVMLGYEHSTLMGLEPWGWLAPDIRGRLASRIRQIRKSSGLVYETLCQTGDGGVFCVEVHSRVVEVEQWGTLVVSVARDMADRSAAHEKMHRLAFYDTLTGLSNRVMLDDRLATALSGSRRHGGLVGLIYMDLDDFKPINDAHGHSVGDRVLRIISERMSNCVREIDTIARVGGDEFIALFPRLTNKSELGAKARAIAECVAQPIALGTTTVSVSVSVGLATYVPGEKHDELIGRADQAMYRAKVQGHAGWEEYLASA